MHTLCATVPLVTKSEQEAVERLLAAFPQEPLCDELAEHLSDEGEFGRVLHHPLVIDPLYAEVMAGHHNRTLAYKRKRLAECAEKGDWYTYVFLHERPYRASALQQVPPDHDGWEMLVGDVWTDTENFHQEEEFWRLIWAIAGQALGAMDEDERAAFDALPDEITVFRGYSHDDAALGISWTLDEDKAEWFARRAVQRSGGTARVAKARVAKDDVSAYFNGRSEQEIVVAHPSALHVEA